jgi:type I restriction enzyme S subunit
VDGKLRLGRCTYVSWAKYHESPEIKIENGDVVLVKTGSTTGKVAYVAGLAHEATLNPQMVVFKRLKINRRYFGFLATTPIFQNQIGATIVGGALPTLSQKQVAGYKIPVPPTDEEQGAIADALSDVDGLLEGLDRLIAKKRDLKQAAMQQLLRWHSDHHC